jgi:hypothetical protein
MKALALSVSFLLPGVVAAQAASYTYIDQKAPYKNPSPAMLTALNLPKVGTTFKVRVPPPWASKSTPCSASYLLAFGIRNPGISSRNLGGYIFSSAEVVIPTPQGTGMVTMSFPIPNSSQLLGVKFFQQVLEVGNWCNGPFPATLGRGGVGVIGK